ncbi:unnamed protein product (macronuclear) [Paramecium tetraurelia]|uniref:Protein kinase domain-containing protein n=1 Tax=Paramecium tetraurelia TaxID=5888 RepID=A0D7E1_PARTE|nr:uncharacterized protein GSPATT00002000001 [Paramecium tetraurelia]CAK78958.1 unnamed protein product [Paramecium tetraurelia]|eukprot:XP_001446355.1 hypothetical protein (macronuclear) [Paramecium tetraurelia strain d4-2]
MKLNRQFRRFYLQQQLPSRFSRLYIHQITGHRQNIENIVAIQTVHGLQYAHKDIKPDNVLLDENFNLKLGDFGLTDNKAEANDGVGTVSYMAPEVGTGKFYLTQKADIFSLGSSFIEIKTGVNPFSNNDREQVYQDLLQQPEKFWTNFEQHLKKEKNLTLHIEKEFKILIQNMLNDVPEKRPSIDQVLSSSYLNLYQTTEDQIITYMQQHLQLKALYEIDLTKVQGANGQAISETMEIEQVGLNEFRFRNINKAKNFQKNVTNFFKKIMIESENIVFETNETLDDVMKSNIDIKEQQGRQLSKFLIRDLDKTCQFGVILELMVDVVNLYIIDVKGARKNLNISKKYLRDSLRKKMKKVETQDI